MYSRVLAAFRPWWSKHTVALYPVPLTLNRSTILDSRFREKDVSQAAPFKCIAKMLDAVVQPVYEVLRQAGEAHFFLGGRDFVLDAVVLHGIRRRCRIRRSWPWGRGLSAGPRCLG